MLLKSVKYLVCLSLMLGSTAFATIGKSVTEGVINTDPMSESGMKQLMIRMLVRHMDYASKQYHSLGEYHYFGNGQSNEHGARTNADYAFICAFLYKYGADQKYPAGLDKEDVKRMAINAIIYSYSTHTANKTQLCTDHKYWGSGEDQYTWESSMWAESIGYATFLLGNELSDQQKEYVRRMITAEADREVTRTIPTGYISDTKAEENGWDTNVLSLAISLYPNDPRAGKWLQKCKEFAMNSYSNIADKEDTTIVDGKPVKDWYIGKTLFDDYTLENHNFFHTSYQNVVIQELSESYLAYHMMQQKYTAPEALKHNVTNVWDKVLSGLALADGELAMPNGNDWSMYLYDQLASYAALATIYRNPDAYMLEQMALKYTAARQSTTDDGAFMLHPDINERRMAVTGRRIAFTYLYHEYFPVQDMKPSIWSDFDQRQVPVRQFKDVGVTYSRSKDRFASFSWMTRKKSFMGMIATSSPDKNKIWIPYKEGNTGNFTGFITTNRASDADVDSVSSNLQSKGFSTNGILSLNQKTMKQYIAYCVTPGNAVIYQDEVVAQDSVSVMKEEGIPMGVSMDPFTSTERMLYTQDGRQVVKGDSLLLLKGNWANIDNQVGAVYRAQSPMAFGKKQLVNSIYTSLLYGAYNSQKQNFISGNVITSRTGIFYSNVDAKTTSLLATQAQYPEVSNGWKAVVAQDLDDTKYLFVSRFYGQPSTLLTVQCKEGAPVFSLLTDISGHTGKTVVTLNANTSLSQPLNLYVSTDSKSVQAVLEKNDPYAAYLFNKTRHIMKVSVTIVKNGKRIIGTVHVNPNCKLFVNIDVLHEYHDNP